MHGGHLVPRAWGPSCPICTTCVLIIIIIIDFYGAYILRNLSSEVQQNRISKRNRKQGRAKVSIRTRDNRTFMVGMQFGIKMYTKHNILLPIFYCLTGQLNNNIIMSPINVMIHIVVSCTIFIYKSLSLSYSKYVDHQLYIVGGPAVHQLFSPNVTHC